MSRSLIILFLVSLNISNSVFAAALPDAGRLLKENSPQSTLVPQQSLPPLQKQAIHEEHVPNGGTNKGFRLYLYRQHIVFEQ